MRKQVFLAAFIFVMSIYFFNGDVVLAQAEWVRAADTKMFQREGTWQETSFRYAERDHLLTSTDGSSITFVFEGADLMLRLGQHAVPAYGSPSLGSLAVAIDNGPERIIYPLAEPNEVVLARNLPHGKHTVRIVHRVSGNRISARIEALGYSMKPTGELAFILTGDHNAYLVDARAIITRNNDTIANRLIRNWLNGQCRIAGLLPGKGYRLELHAIGWMPYAEDGIIIEAGHETALKPIHLSEAPPGVANGWLFPHIGRQAVKKPGESFRARLQAYNAKIIAVRIERKVGPATISRKLSFKEDSSAGFYYDREIICHIQPDTPPGLYDLIVEVTDPARTFITLRSVMIVKEYPADPVFVSWGHLDTQGQYQAEYLRDLVSIANLAGADMVLMSTACNPAYVAGALSSLDVPHVVNFGNHQFPGFEQWFGPQEGVTDFGPDICVLNRSLAWHESSAQADALLEARSGTRIKVINSFEHNAPIDLLDKHRVALVHDGHGTGDRVMDMGSTPTKRVGKSNSESFRVIRFSNGRVASCTYLGDPFAPIPFPRGSIPPLRMVMNPVANGINSDVVVTIKNDLGEAFPNCRITVVMPAGLYKCQGGLIENASTSDCGRFSIITLRADAPAESLKTLRISPG